MRHSRKRTLGTLAVAALTLGLALSGCGARSISQVGLAATRSTPTVTPSPTPAAIFTPSLMPIVWPIPKFPGCTDSGNSPVQQRFTSVGALKLSLPMRELDHPSELMPSDAPNGPYKLAASAVTNYQPNPPVNPSVSAYMVEVCNETSAAHTLTGLNVTITSFSASSGPINVWHICGDGPYDAATGNTTPGCGGAIGGSAVVAVTLPRDSTGASAPITGLSWPVSIDPGKSVVLDIRVQGLTSHGTYALSFDVGADGAAPVTVAAGDGSFLMAPSATIWTGTACQTPAMQAQIPPASQDTYYVCPPAP